MITTIHIGNTGTSRPANNKNEMSEVIAAVAKKGQAMSERNKLAYGVSIVNKRESMLLF